MEGPNVRGDTTVDVEILAADEAVAAGRFETADEIEEEEEEKECADLSTGMARKGTIVLLKEEDEEDEEEDKQEEEAEDEEEAKGAG
jgi:hypothetical protein